jgi:dipeptidyl aminopeptidase/acylaminoacyl peptidase
MNRTIVGFWALFCALSFLPGTNVVAQEQRISAIEESTEETVPDLVVPIQAARSGKLAYVSYSPVKGIPGWQFFLKVTTTAPQPSTQTFHVKASNFIFDPQFSPDGRKILFKFGWPNDRFSSYLIYLFDLQTKRWREGPALPLSYRVIRWSPDGRYLAFASGGDLEGNEWPEQTAPLRLFTYDVKTEKLRQLAEDAWVKEFGWTARNTLLYSSYGIKAENGKGPLPPLPNVYEFDPVAGQPRMKRALASCARLSPDGTWLAYWGLARSPDEKKVPKANLPGQADDSPGLYIRNLMSGDSKLVRNVGRADFSALAHWDSDSKALIVGKYTYSKGEGKIRLGLVNPSEGTWRQVVEVTTQDKIPMRRNSVEAQYDVLDVSGDGRSCVIKAEEIAGIVNGRVQTSVSLLDVDLAVGTVTRIMTVKNPLGLDWQSLSTH